MDAKTFGQYLRDLRKQQKKTLKELGKEVDLSQPYLSQIENGERGIPSPDVLQKLSEPLGVPHSILMLKAGHLRNGGLLVNGEFIENPDEALLKMIRSASDGVVVNGATLSAKEAEKFLIKSIEERNREITFYLQKTDLFYNGHLLTNQDRQRILDMLKALFPEYAIKEE